MPDQARDHQTTALQAADGTRVYPVGEVPPLPPDRAVELVTMLARMQRRRDERACASDRDAG